MEALPPATRGDAALLCADEIGKEAARSTASRLTHAAFHARRVLSADSDAEDDLLCQPPGWKPNPIGVMRDAKGGWMVGVVGDPKGGWLGLSRPSAATAGGAQPADAGPGEAAAAKPGAKGRTVGFFFLLTLPFEPTCQTPTSPISHRMHSSQRVVAAVLPRVAAARAAVKAPAAASRVASAPSRLVPSASLLKRRQEEGGVDRG